MSGRLAPALRERSLSAAELAQVADVEGLGADVLEPIRYLIAMPGKQLRSLLTIRSAALGTTPDVPAVRIGAAIVELFQMATLAHDDVVDDAELRRGEEAVSRRFGPVASGFSGGVLFARALELVSAFGQAPTRRFVETAECVCTGQMAEFAQLFDSKRSEEDYFTAVDGKTASLFGFAAWLGGTLGGCPAENAAVLNEAAHQFGVAFQIADDILDLIADPAATGKPPGQDLRQGIYTLPVIHAMSIDASVRRMLALSGADANAVVRQVQGVGAVEYAVAECRRRASYARARLTSTFGDRPDELDAVLDLCSSALAPLHAVLEERMNAGA